MTKKRKTKWNEDFCKNRLLDLYNSGKSLSPTECHGTSLYKNAARIFGSWYKAMISVGLNPDTFYKHKPQKFWTKEKISIEIKLRVNNNEKLSDSFVNKNNKSLYMASIRHFGSWRKAIEYSGIEYKEIMETQFAIGLDGHIYDSKNEAIISNLLFLLSKEKFLTYKPHFLINTNRKWTADFYINFSIDNSFLYFEYDGVGEKRTGNIKGNYDTGSNQKINFYIEKNYNFFVSKSIKSSFVKILEISYGEKYTHEIFEKYISNLEIYKYKNISKKDKKMMILNDIKSIVNKLGRAPSSYEYDNLGKFSRNCVSHFGGRWSNILELLGFNSNDARPRGERSGVCKFSENLVIEFRRDFLSGLSCKQIAEKYGFSISGVGHAISGRSWKHIDYLLKDCINECLHRRRLT